MGTKTNMENVLQYINGNFVSIADDDVKETNIILQKVLDEITTSIRSVNRLFHHLFETKLYGGSFFDGLKVGKPDEFDIDLKLLLPKILDIQLEPTDKDGFVFVKLKDWSRLTADTYLYTIYRDLERLKDNENYLSQDKVKRWMQGIVQESINNIRERGVLDDVELKPSMSGPAVTLNVTYKHYNMDIDLVAVFRVSGDKWPELPVRQNKNRICTNFLVVPKPPKDVSLNSERYWRLSFPEQEREMIKRLYHCKPALRLLKKLRDAQGHSIICSYFIKTIFLWEIEVREGNNSVAFWNSSLTKVFLHMLETYKNYLVLHEIPYFWNKNHNFLEFVSPITITNIKNYLERMIKKINTSSDPFIVAKYLLNEEELEQLQGHFNGDFIDNKTILPSSSFNQSPQPLSVGHSWMPEPRSYFPDENKGSQQQQEEESGISTGTFVAGAAAVAVSIGLLGLFAYARSQRNQNN